MKRALLILAAIFTGAFSRSSAAPLAVGAAAPDITAPDQEGNPVDFAAIYRQGVTLVYFYPKADTPGCTAEACSLRDSYARLKAQGLQVIGVSRDNPNAQKKFQTKYQLPFTLVADADGKVAEAFGVPMMMGGLIPVATRQSFIVKDHKIAWNSLHAQTKGSSDEVQKALDGLR